MWQRLAKPYLQSEIKRCVRCDDGYALIDLYFPTVNVGVELDEAHHLGDAHRMSEKDLDEGEAVEVYAAPEGTQARRDYLFEFDGTIPYSGSYVLVGTMVIQTSRPLDDDTQYVLTVNIVVTMAETQETGSERYPISYRAPCLGETKRRTR